MDMSVAHYERALELAAALEAKNHHGELNLAGIGESTMHPRFVEFVRRARATLPHVRLVLATNGLLMDRAMAEAIAPFKIDVFVSLHQPVLAAGAVIALRDVGILAGISSDAAALNATDWAGQVKWQVTTPAKGSPCPWVRGGWSIVLADGRVSRCCFDASGIGVIGHIEDDTWEQWMTTPYKLCSTCHLKVGVQMEAAA